MASKSVVQSTWEPMRLELVGRIGDVMLEKSGPNTDPSHQQSGWKH
jgi:hypothetical protein